MRTVLSSDPRTLSKGGCPGGCARRAGPRRRISKFSKELKTPIYAVSLPSGFHLANQFPCRHPKRLARSKTVERVGFSHPGPHRARHRRGRLCEIQQYGDMTYRLYDWNRRPPLLFATPWKSASGSLTGRAATSSLATTSHPSPRRQGFGASGTASVGRHPGGRRNPRRPQGSRRRGLA